MRQETVMDEYSESDETRVKKSDIAKERPRDENGHFLSDEEIEEKKRQTSTQNFFTNQTHLGKSHDDNKLLDVHVSNPLKRITELLEDLKRQKAFSFTLKGSLGLAGVALALSLFGIFGGQKMFCDKGTQTKIGTVMVLNIAEEEKSDFPIIGPLIDFYSGWFENPYEDKKLRTVLVNENDTIHMPVTRFVDLTGFDRMTVFATGDYNSCSETLKIKDPQNLQIKPNP